MIPTEKRKAGHLEVPGVGLRNPGPSRSRDTPARLFDEMDTKKLSPGPRPTELLQSQLPGSPVACSLFFSMNFTPKTDCNSD